MAANQSDVIVPARGACRLETDIEIDVEDAGLSLTPMALLIHTSQETKRSVQRLS